VRSTLRAIGSRGTSLTFGIYHMKSIAIFTLVISQLLLCSLGYAAQDEAYTKFKQKWSPEVGHMVTVEGTLAGSKLGYALKFDGFSFEILSTDSKSLPKLNKLGKFQEHKMRASGILRFNPAIQARALQDDRSPVSLSTSIWI